MILEVRLGHNKELKFFSQNFETGDSMFNMRIYGENLKIFLKQDILY